MSSTAWELERDADAAVVYINYIALQLPWK
jgi:hypothetical protein